MTYNRGLIRLPIPLIAMMGVVLCLQVGCSFDAAGIAGPTPDADPNVPDAPPTPDVPPGDPCLEWMPAPAHFNPCAIMKPQGGLTLTVPGTYTYDTGFGVLEDPQSNAIAHVREELMQSNPVIRLISVENFTLGPDSTLRVTGPIPLLIASWSTITVDGTIDVSSSTTIGPGAGYNTGTCNAAEPGQPDNNDGDGDIGGGGGGGGGFGDDGGDGGDGGKGDGLGGGKGTALGASPANVRGGCPGAKGGKGDRDDGGGGGGNGGGAIQLTARLSITINGKLHAGGQGGGGANADEPTNDLTRDSGGGGGGSGGMLGLESSTIMLGTDAILAANGGAGGGGCDNGLAAIGEDGRLDDAKANKGGKNGNGGDGGDGGHLGSPAGVEGQGGDSGGGGGGGGVGYIIMSTTPMITGSPKISPDYVTP
jgi:hypothetical protein